MQIVVTDFDVATEQDFRFIEERGGEPRLMFGHRVHSFAIKGVVVDPQIKMTDATAARLAAAIQQVLENA